MEVNHPEAVQKGSILEEEEIQDSVQQQSDSTKSWISQSENHLKHSMKTTQEDFTTTVNQHTLTHTLSHTLIHSFTFHERTDSTGKLFPLTWYSKLFTGPE